MTNTPNLAMPFIAPGQAQKHVTHNEALIALYAVVQLVVLDRMLSAPPDEPEDGDRYIVGPSASGTWADHERKIAAWQDGAWRFYDPQEGWRAWCIADHAELVFDGSDWVVPGASGQAGTLGVNASADEQNRLTVSSPGTLLTHDGAGHRLAINKAGATDTGSVLFQSSYSGRAEIGLAGDDVFRVKVSEDGDAWNTALAAFPDGRTVIDGAVEASSFLTRTEQVIGNDGPFETDGVSQISNNSMYGFAEAVAASGVLRRIRCHAVASGTVLFRRYVVNGTDVTQTGDDIPVDVVPGLNMVDVDVAVSAGDLLGFSHPPSQPITFKPGVPGPSWIANGTIANILTTHALNVAFDIETTASAQALPQRIRNVDGTIGSADAGSHLLHTSADPHIWTLPDVDLPVGSPPIVLVNTSGAGAVTIDPAAGLDLQRGDGQPGSGPRTLPPGSVATLLKIATSTWILTGAFA